MRKGHVPAAVPAKPYELERLRDPETAAAYLSIAAKEDDLAAFLQACLPGRGWFCCEHAAALSRQRFPRPKEQTLAVLKEKFGKRHSAGRDGY